MRNLYRIGRAIVGGFFLYNGINHLRHPQELAGYAASKHVAYPGFSVQASGVLLTAVGASLLLGVKPKLGATGALGFLSAVSPLFHDFWHQQNPEAKQRELVNFSKNVALAGATVALLGAEDENSHR